jgi:hypothetical protein
LTAEPAIVVNEDIDDEFIDASMRDTELKMESPRQSAPFLPGRSPYDEATRGTEQNVVFSNEPMPLSPTRFPFSDEHETASFGASDLARSNYNSSNGRESPYIMTNELSQTQGGTNMRNDGLPPIPQDNLGRTQHGVTVRRAVHKCRRMSMVNNSKFKSSRSLENVNVDDKSLISPFDRSLSSRNLDTSLNGSNPLYSPSPERRTRGGFESPQIMRVDSGQYT